MKHRIKLISKGEPIEMARRKAYRSGISKRQRLNEARKQRLKSAAINSRLRRSVPNSVIPATRPKLMKSRDNFVLRFAYMIVALILGLKKIL